MVHESSNSNLVYSLKPFWVKSLSIRGVYQDYEGNTRNLSERALGQARRGELRQVSPGGLLFLLEVASGFAGRPVDAREIIASDE